MSSIRIGRAKNPWASRFRGFQILINGQTVGTLERGQTLDFEVPPGYFTLRASIDWCASPTLDGTIGGDQILSFEVSNGDTFTGLFKGDTYLDLRPLREKA